MKVLLYHKPSHVEKLSQSILILVLNIKSPAPNVVELRRLGIFSYRIDLYMNTFALSKKSRNKLVLD